MATPRYLSGVNGYLPKATGQVISYIRDPKKFKVNKYVQNIQSPLPTGLYYQLDKDAPVRVVTDAEFAWEDGDPRPTGHSNLSNFQLTEFRTFRRDYPFTLGQQAIEATKKAGAFDPLAYESAQVASQAMTNRTNRIVALLETAAGWGNNTATATALNGGAGKWNQASGDITDPSYLAIKKTILEACRRINLATNAVVQLSDLRLILSPGLAIAMAETSEIHDYIAKSRFAQPNLENLLGNPNELWGLPPNLYGVEVIVEDAPIVKIRPTSAGTDAALAAGQRQYCKADTSAVLCTRIGGIDGPFGVKSFTTLQCYFYKYELAVATFADSKNELTEGHVVEQFKEILAAPTSGFLITGTV